GSSSRAGAHAASASSRGLSFAERVGRHDDRPPASRGFLRPPPARGGWSVGAGGVRSPHPGPDPGARPERRAARARDLPRLHRLARRFRRHDALHRNRQLPRALPRLPLRQLVQDRPDLGRLRDGYPVRPRARARAPAEPASARPLARPLAGARPVGDALGDRRDHVEAVLPAAGRDPQRGALPRAPARLEHRLALGFQLGTARSDPRRRLGRHAADDDRPPCWGAVGIGRYARGGRGRRRHRLAALPDYHAAAAAPGDHRHYHPRPDLEPQLVRARLGAHARRAGPLDRAADALRLQRGVQIRAVRLRVGARRRDGCRHHVLPDLLPVGTPEGGDGMIVSPRPKTARTAQYVALSAYILFLGFPLLWMLSVSLKGPRELVELHPHLIPQDFTLANFGTGLHEYGMLHDAWNSFKVASLTAVIVTLIAIPAAYVLARQRGLISKLGLGWILLSQMFPLILIIIPLFLVLRDLHLVDSHAGLV